jgi:glycosyltransferase involved in cell wall biosynthesis
MKDESPAVSIITPVFNGERYIEDCIESIRNQIDNNVEHIIVDGGSNDNTLAILKEHPNIKWITGSDKGMYDAINKGVKLAKGNIIGYLNADDRYFRYTLSKVRDTFNNYPESDFIYGSCTYIDNNGKKLFTFKPLRYSRKLFKNMGRICWAQPSCFWRKEVHNKIGYFDSGLRYCGDYEFFLRLILNDLKGCRVNIPLSLFMIHDNALSRRFREEMAEECRRIELKYSLRQNRLLGFAGELLFKLINKNIYLKTGKNKIRI